MSNFWKSLMTVRCIHTCRTSLRETPNNLKGKSVSSQKWLVRQLKDPYVELAKQEKYRCRSAFKLLEINDRFNILIPGLVVVDCGAAPGSWTQVAVKHTNADGSISNKPKGIVFAIDRLPIYPIDGATVVGNMDFTTQLAQDTLRNLLNGKQVDLVMSDMAPNASGVKHMDHDNIIRLAYLALKFALHISKVNATFLAKLWDGGQSTQFEQDVGKFYKNIKIVRPAATRDDSSEKFVLAKGFKGLKTS
ncbi:rRNA methyltransferase 2, mitochondrial [Cephus cinctus]|uniref:rRNA methyltransferase 2, mitochondrial n=1 Tax=Cephus cinctus TaxID=211228 RepID=A0AAJ7CEC4_CEPCN|nr:rRNA methyltransferase 2, mitochondrial [Cephus cinctus]